MADANPTPVIVVGGMYLCLGAGGALWMQSRGVRPWPDDGLTLGPLALAVGVGLGVGGALHAAYRPLHGHRALRALERAVTEAAAAIGVQNLFALLPGAVLAEEVFFRGAMQPAWGWLTAAVLFGLAHFLPPRRELWLYPVLASLAGGAFGFAYWITGGHLVAPFVAHLTVNAANLGLARPELLAAEAERRARADELELERGGPPDDAPPDPDDWD